MATGSAVIRAASAGVLPDPAIRVFRVGVGGEPGIGLGWGLSSWLFGPMLYIYGYFPYANPYDRASKVASRRRACATTPSRSTHRRTTGKCRDRSGRGNI